jgi:deoxyhypusine synthase
MNNKGPVSQFIEHNYRHFNAAALVDAAKGYETHLLEGGKMLVSIAGAMSTAELGVSLAEMIRQDKIAIISCTGANLEELPILITKESLIIEISHRKMSGICWRRD